MKKYEGFLLCTDFDGTFALPGAQMDEENLKAVRHFQQNGGLFTIASGRSPEFIRGYADHFRPNAPLIVLNGTMICDETSDAPIARFPLDHSVLDVLDALAETGLPERIMLVTDADCRIEWTSDCPVTPGGLLRDAPGTWYKTLLCQPPEKTLALRALYAERGYDRLFNAERSWNAGFELHAVGSGKGECVRWLKDRFGGRVHTTVGAGDYDNDLSLVRDSDIGYAVANATDDVKAAAKRITVPHTEHAIARIIDELG